jgi:hypothetical protein
MNVRGWLIQLYPHVWRERYGEEFEALLEDCLRSPIGALDVVAGALDAWLQFVSEAGLNWRLAAMDPFVHKKDLAFVVTMVITTATLDITVMALAASAYFEGMTVTALSIAAAGVVATLGLVALAARKIRVVYLTRI